MQTGAAMLDRKALADKLHDLHKSELESGLDAQILKDAIGKIIDAISASSTGLGEDDGRHLLEAVEALRDGHYFSARSSILLILEGTQHRESAGHAPPVSLEELRGKLNNLAA